MPDGGGGKGNAGSVSSPSVTCGATSPWRGRIRTARRRSLSRRRPLLRHRRPDQRVLFRASNPVSPRRRGSRLGSRLRGRTRGRRIAHWPVFTHLLKVKKHQLVQSPARAVIPSMLSAPPRCHPVYAVIPAHAVILTKVRTQSHAQHQPAALAQRPSANPNPNPSPIRNRRATPRPIPLSRSARTIRRYGAPGLHPNPASGVLPPSL